MKTRIIRFLSILALSVFAFSLTACSNLTDAELETIEELLNANDITTEQLRALELTPEVKEVICDIIADECEKKGVVIDRDFLKSLDLDYTALADYKVAEEDYLEFKENMNWDPAITKQILDNLGVDEAEVNETLKETGLTEDELLILLEAANDPEVESFSDVMHQPKVRDIGVNLHVDVPELGIKLDDVPIGEIVDATDESIAAAKEAGTFLQGIGVPVDTFKEYLTPPKVKASDVIATLEPVGEVTREISKNIDPTIIRDIIEGRELDVNKLVPVDGYDEIIDEAQGYVDELIEEFHFLRAMVKDIIAVDHSDIE